MPFTTFFSKIIVQYIFLYKKLFTLLLTQKMQKTDTFFYSKKTTKVKIISPNL